MQCSHHDENTSCIAHVPIFANLSEEEMLEIADIAVARNYDKGDMVYLAGEEGGTLFVLHTGKAKLFRLNASGKEQVLRVAGAGEFFGELSLFSSLPLSDNAQILEEATMCVIKGDRLKELMQKYPSIAFKVMDELSRRLESAESRIESITLSPVLKRIAAALLELSTGEQDIRLPMTKGDFASQLGMTQETLSRKLSELEAEGIIALKGQRAIRIEQPDKLREISEKQDG